MDTHSKTLPLDLTREVRRSTWDALHEIIEQYNETVEELPVAPKLDPDAIRQLAESYRFSEPMEAEEAVRRVASELIRLQVHTPHPAYFGLFNPAPTAMSVAADALVAAVNPQLAAWSHSPFAVEVERHVALSLAEKFGFSREYADGVFTSGGAEANQTAVLAALTNRWPELATRGLRGLQGDPVLYVSAEGHHSFLKAARSAGLGANALRSIPVNEQLQMDPATLRNAIARDRDAGLLPFLVIATAGTTGAGVIDPLREIAEVARECGAWFHVDAAWGGGAALVPEMRHLLSGIELADSITFDAHKWLSVSMGAGMFLTRHPDILNRCFATETAYMPKEAPTMQAADPFSHSIQWSRRFIGLKLFLSLAVAGWEGCAAAIRHQTEMGNLLRTRLQQEGWRVVNRTELPLVCFTDDRQELDAAACQRISNAVVASGKAWISTIQLGTHKKPALRACITNYKTEPKHLETLLAALNAARRAEVQTVVK